MKRYPRDMQRFIDEAPPEYKNEAEHIVRQMMKRRWVVVITSAVTATIFALAEILAELLIRR